MKRSKVVLAVGAVALFASFAFNTIKLGSITGKISSADTIAEVSLIVGADTVRTPFSQGSFTFANLKQGVYKVWIKANLPYKDLMIENVAVKDSSTTDLGTISIQQ